MVVGAPSAVGGAPMDWSVGWLLVSVAVRCDPQDPAGGGLDDGPPAGVFHRVVVLAQQLEISGGGVAAVGIVEGVVVLADPGRCLAAGCPAGPVPDGDPPLEFSPGNRRRGSVSTGGCGTCSLTAVIGCPVSMSTNPRPPAEPVPPSPLAPPSRLAVAAPRSAPPPLAPCDESSGPCPDPGVDSGGGWGRVLVTPW